MALKVVVCLKQLITSNRSFSWMYIILMIFSFCLCFEAFATMGAREGSIFCVNSLVVLSIFLCFKWLFTLITYMWPSFVWTLQWRSRYDLVLKALKHVEQWKGFRTFFTTVRCRSQWIRKWSLLPTAFLHTSQKYFFSPLWTLSTWVFKSVFLLYVLGHLSHTNSCRPWCTSLCCLSSLIVKNAFSHSLHSCFFLWICLSKCLWSSLFFKVTKQIGHCLRCSKSTFCLILCVNWLLIKLPSPFFELIWYLKSRKARPLQSQKSQEYLKPSWIVFLWTVICCCCISYMNIGHIHKL